jgi:hypothetical protein
MKTLGTVAAFISAVAFMAGIIIAQRDYQRSWNDTTLSQAVAANTTVPATLDHQNLASSK